MSKKGLLLVAIMCGVFAPAFMVADCQESECPVKYEYCVDQDVKFIEDALVEFYEAKMLGKKSLAAKENYDEAVTMIDALKADTIKRGRGNDLMIRIIDRIKEVALHAKIETALTMDEIKDEIINLFNLKKCGDICGDGICSCKECNGDVSLKKEATKEKSDEKLIGQI